MLKMAAQPLFELASPAERLYLTQSLPQEGEADASAGEGSIESVPARCEQHCGFDLRMS